MKDQVYSWRISTQKKAELEKARPTGQFSGAPAEQITADWLHERRHSRNGDEAEQATLKRRVMATVGTIRIGDPTRSLQGQAAGPRIRQRHAKESNASRRTD